MIQPKTKKEKSLKTLLLNLHTEASPERLLLPPPQQPENQKRKELEDPSIEPPAKRAHTEASSERLLPPPPQQPFTSSSQIREAHTSMTVWPEYPKNFPHKLFENFSLPSEKKSFEDISVKISYTPTPCI